ncbi:disintegrin and metalloproteinase domain-containing protein 10-like isoform X2 [Anticarsia gemmatalis]|uniref:disintegrin and metalloproteinase domain-containing protein 10-like isoform X2 n=1 Tax=Anticarsia gemmatalis TaxID=129554 RepID=UPI003F767B66
MLRYMGLALVLILPYIESVPRLSEYIEHYEPLEYDADSLHEQHLRARRSTDPSVDLILNFRALEKDFNLRLRRDISTFSDGLQVESAGQMHEVDTSHIYNGELIDDPQSTVFGSVTDGVFEGKIVASDGSFYVEHARRYFPPNGTRTRVHSVIYREGDVSDHYAHRRHGHKNGCGMTDDVLQWMDRYQTSGIDEGSLHQLATPLHPSSLRDDLPSQQKENSRHLRHKRYLSHDKRHTCSLFIHTDPYVWQHIRQGFHDHNDASQTSEVNTKTREEILSLISHHVMAVNYIYSHSKFDGRFEHRNIKFEVQRIKIDTDTVCYSSRYGEEPYPFCKDNLDARDLLKQHSLENHEDFCLAYMITYRQFSAGELGLAWLAKPEAPGGICSKYETYSEKIGDESSTNKLSLNTGVITLLNYNSRVPPKISQLTLAHQIGHNFGSPHDYPSECRPGGQQGNFIMFASATSGDRPNNSRFSSCSIGNISQVLDAVRDGRKRNCLTTSEGAFCGNKIVEVGEECDCGYDEAECYDRCCYPRVISMYEREKNITAKGCTRKAHTQCSPSEGPCCHPGTCQFIPAHRNYTCKEETECSHTALCSGHSAECPAQKNKQGLTSCNNGTKICIQGECSGSMCLAWNMTECSLSSAQPHIIGESKVLDRRALCHLACQTGATADTCQSTMEFASSVGISADGISLPPGSPCDNFEGYCDLSLNCQPIEDGSSSIRRENSNLSNNYTFDGKL